MNKYYLNNKEIILNFSLKFCVTEVEVLQSEAFFKVLNKYISKLKEKNHFLYTNYLKNKRVEDIINTFKMLLTFTYSQLYAIDKTLDKDKLSLLIEGLYDYWRLFERYGIIEATSSGYLNKSFTTISEEFTTLILRTYRTIAINAKESDYLVYRQLPAGVNATLLVSKSKLNNILTVSSIVLRPPFISYSAKNKRDGFFNEINYNPLKTLDSKIFICFKVLVGTLKANVYVHRDFLSHGIALANLFQLDNDTSSLPDLIYVFGMEETDLISFYHDVEQNVYIGVAKYSLDIDYFGYMKKMLLTLHNVCMINNGYLPVHGACVNITLKNNISKTICLIGDSGAGKSESLEALRKLLKDDINEMKIIFDDMGTFKIIDNQIYAYGTEIGAFVRLDDLENGYAMKEMDRAIFTNPDKINSRLIIPVSNYEDIIKGFKVDVVLYANNYYDSKETFRKISSLNEALEVFSEGKRFAKGTTTENGIVTSFFANPFGPVQRKAQTEKLLVEYFKLMLDQSVLVGEVYTKLGLNGMEFDGPLEVSKFLKSILV